LKSSNNYKAPANVISNKPSRNKTVKPENIPTKGGNGTDIKSRLSKLKKLEDAGLITKEEAAEKRKAILDSL
jgi:hypothetical protein